jgi:cellulose synthase/poly-beta-1,6-N-acetylglucosamine synthase-like glycosyltransferase
MKSPKLYNIILITWILLVILFAKDLVSPLVTAEHINPLTFTTVLLATLFVLYFWLNGLKDVIYTLYFYFFYKKGSSWAILEPSSLVLEHEVELIYCTHNDFVPASLLACMQQDYKNFETIICDDSTDPIKQQEVKAFAEKYNVKVIRRESSVGHKAGNLNNYLRTSDAEFVVILDADEIIPKDFVTKALPYFANPQIAVLQGNHIAVDDQNKFMSMYSAGVESHWNTYQAIKNDFGFLSFLGHGAMLRMTAYREVSGFPELVAEDLCYSIELRRRNYFVYFAKEIVCFEQYPISYLAFKKRHAKWTQGNMEFIKKYTIKVFSSRMHWYEKLDIVLFTYSLPLSVAFAVYLLINIVVLPLIHFRLNYPLAMLVPTIVFLAAPMLNDAIFFRRTKGFLKVASYLFFLLLLYGSMFFVSFKASLYSLFQQAQFIVTPKEKTSVGRLQALRMNSGELVFGILLICVSFFFLGSILPVFLIAIPSLSSVFLTRLSNE